MAHEEGARGVILFGSEKGRLRTNLTVMPTSNWFMMEKTQPWNKGLVMWRSFHPW